ncbi:Alpha/Beta hydrolase protein [Gloeopeniophorella convolvens]|nr:Alpha/Beta hydrolase protein [Gloeopeniophorella convolvens]
MGVLSCGMSVDALDQAPGRSIIPEQSRFNCHRISDLPSLQLRSSHAVELVSGPAGPPGRGNCHSRKESCPVRASAIFFIFSGTVTRDVAPGSQPGQPQPQPRSLTITMGSLLSRRPAGHRTRSKVYWPQNPAQLTVKVHDSKTVEKTSLRTLIETRCPSVLTPFKGAWWLFNGHLQTGYAVVGDFAGVDKVVYDRKFLKLKDGGTLGVDFTPPVSTQRTFDETTPVVVALHGLTGGSHESYVRNIIAPAITPVEEGGLGYRAVVVNFRGCAGVPLTSPQLYGFSHTDDFRQAVHYIAQIYPRAPLLGLGFSLGANVLTRYVAEEGEACRLSSACVLACPWDIEKNGHMLTDSWFLRNVYSKGLGTNLKNLVTRHLDSIRQFPDSPFAQALPTLLSYDRTTMLQFDSIISIHSAGSSPPFPLSDAWAYYAYASSHHKLDAIRIPFLALNSDDDPLVQSVPHGYNQNEWVTIVVTRGGGHMGWFQSGGAGDRWAKQPTLEWFRATAEDTILPPRKVSPIEWRDGWLVEVGREDLGCQEIGDGGTIEGAAGQEGDLLAGL